ncbi:MAG: WD40/YVTN/BNR-like repeat-containing protein [Thermoplasmata archaeon]
MASDRKVRVLIGTRKGGYIAESDTSRRRWSVRGPMHEGHEVFHMAADPRRPGDVYAAVNNAFWGPMMFRSSNWGKSWTELAPPLMPKRADRPPPEGDPRELVRPVTNVWRIEPGPVDEPNTIFLGIDPASLFRSDDRGASWSPVSGINEHPTRAKWNPGAGGMCLHTILLDPTNPKRMYVGISAAGTFRSDDGGEHFRPVNQGVSVSFMPEKRPEFGQCVHHIVLDPENSNVLYRQDHDGIYVSRDGMESWKRVGRPLRHDFGFVAASAPALPGEAFFVPLNPMARTTFDGGMQVYRWTERTRSWKAMMPQGKWVGEYGTHREGMSTDRLDPAGIYVGTTTGQVFYSRSGGTSWDLMPRNFPAIHSVNAASPPG